MDIALLLSFGRGNAFGLGFRYNMEQGNFVEQEFALQIGPFYFWTATGMRHTLSFLGNVVWRH